MTKKFLLLKYFHLQKTLNFKKTFSDKYRKLGAEHGKNYIWLPIIIIIQKVGLHKAEGTASLARMNFYNFHDKMS